MHFLYTKNTRDYTIMIRYNIHTYSDLELADVAVVVAVVIKRIKRKLRTVCVKPWLEKRCESGVFKLCRLLKVTSHKLSTSSQKAMKFSS